MGPILSLNGPSDKPGTIHTQAAVDRATKGVRAHAEQLRAELTKVLEPANWIVTDRIWRKLDAMSDAEREAFLRQTADEQVIAAVVHAPGAFPLASEATLRTLLTNYARAHRPEKMKLLDDAEAFVQIVDEFRDALLRRFREIR
jgi:hypothetical protein